MNLLSRKKNIKESIPLISLLSALTVILNVLGTYLPVSSLIIVLFLSLPSLFIGLLIPKKYYYIYFLTSLILSLITSISNLSFVISFTIPSLIIGLLYGYFIEKKMNTSLLILISTLIYFILEIVFIPLTNLIINDNYLNLILKLLNLEINNHNYYIIYNLILISSFLGILLSSFIINYEIKRFNLSFNFNKLGDYILSISSITFSIITLIIFFINKDLSSIFFAISFISFILLIMNNILIKEYKYLYFLLIIIPLYLIFIFLNIEYYSLIYFLLYPFIYSLIILIHSLIKRFKNN